MHVRKALDQAFGHFLFRPTADNDQMEIGNASFDHSTGLDEEWNTLQLVQRPAKNTNGRPQRYAKPGANCSSVVRLKAFHVLTDLSRVD